MNVPCLTEFECAVYADGELPPRQAREVAEHVAACAACGRLVEAWRIESQVLVYCLQNTDFIEFELEDETLSTPQAATLGVTRFAAFVLAIAVLLRPVLSVFSELELPDGLDWLNPFRLSGQISLLTATVAYLVPAAIDLLNSILSNAAWLALSAIVFLVIVMFSRKSAFTSATLSALALLTVFSSSSYALDVRRDESPVTVPPGETIDDTLVVVGNAVVVDGTITGDLIAFVRQVTVRGTVKGNVVSFAQRVEIDGTVEGSLMGFAQTMRTRGQIAHNIYTFAQTSEIARDARIEGNATMFAGDSDIEGTIGKDAFVGAATVNVLAPARIGGNFNARVGKPDNAHIDSGALIAGKTSVQASQPRPSRYSTLSFYIWQTIWLVAAFVTGIVLFSLVPLLSRIRLETSRDLLISAGVGCLTIVGPPVAAVLAGITLIGLPLGLMTLALWIAAAYLAKIVIAAFLGRSLLVSAGDPQPATALMLIAGLVPVFIAVNLPYIGGLISFLLTVLGLGMLAVTVYRLPRWRQAPQAA